MQIGSIEGDPIRFADWAELRVLYSSEIGISLESIRTEVDVEGLLGEDSDDLGLPDEASQSLVSDTVREIQRRMAHGGKGYPFRLKNDRLELRPGIPRKIPYTFCLMVSDRDYWTSGDRSPMMFEQIASDALGAYLQGSSFRFGAPRNAPERQIMVALQRLSERTGDPLSGNYPVRSTDKDLGLDVVGWKNFLDGQTSKILVYMQCATGEDWPSKKGDLDINLGGVWNRTIVWTAPPVKAIAVPYVVAPGEEWDRVTPGLLLMDRLRISSLLPAQLVSDKGIDWSSWFTKRQQFASKDYGF